MSHTGITDSPFKFRNRAGQKFQQAIQNRERLVVPIYSFVSPVASRSLRESNNIDVTKNSPQKRENSYAVKNLTRSWEIVYVFLSFVCESSFHALGDYRAGLRVSLISQLPLTPNEKKNIP